VNRLKLFACLCCLVAPLLFAGCGSKNKAADASGIEPVPDEIQAELDASINQEEEDV
jgi:hypothetical protein